MFSGPLFRREYRVASSKRRRFLFRALFTILLVVAAMLIGVFVATAASADDTQTRLIYFGRALLLWTIGVQFLFLAFFVPSQAASAVAGEREKDTLLILLLTRLWPIEIVLTKTAGRWLASIDVILISLPVIVVSALLAGLRIEIVWTVLVMLSSAGFMTALSVLSSARQERVVVARGQAVGLIYAWLVMIPIITLIPIASGTIWGDLLLGLRQLCAIIAPSSPLSLVTDRGWYLGPQAMRLEGRVAMMIGLQALFGLLATLAAATSLQIREPSPNWADPTRGHRPRCGDDPIYWREFELPRRRGAGPLLLVRLRYVWILIRALLMTLLALAGNLLAIAVPVGLLIATIYYGSAAFQEYWQAGQAEPYVARTRFNFLIRVATGVLALIPSLSVFTVVTAQITTDRDKRAWEFLLTTPLTGEEILRSKAKAALHGLWMVAWPLPLLWAMGIACGVLMPIGVVLAAIDLPLLAWMAVATGLLLGIRPSTGAQVTNLSSLGGGVCLALHVTLLAALLASPWEYARFAALDFRLRAVAILAGLDILILTATLAWWATRKTINRFEEWVGRPTLSGRVEPQPNPVTPAVEIGTLRVR